MKKKMKVMMQICTTKLLREHEANHAKAHIELALFCNQRLLTLEEKVRKDFEKKNKIK